MQNTIKAFLMLIFAFPILAFSKEIALSFDDAPFWSTKHFDTEKRTDELIRKLKSLNVSQSAIFANPCKRDDTPSVVRQLKKYRNAGHLIANHTCDHPRFDDIGFAKFSADVEKADKILSPIVSGQKFFRFPFLNEGTDVEARDQMRNWLIQHQYRNGMVSVDNDDYIFSFKINQAKEKRKAIDYGKVKNLFLEHLLGAVEFYDALAVKALGRSPKHVILLHEMDSTVMYIDSFVEELRRRDWKIIPVEEAYNDELYSSTPKNTYGNNGIVAQSYFEKTGVKTAYDKFEEVKAKLDTLLKIGLNGQNK